jgi:hypothetical protein
MNETIVKERENELKGVLLKFSQRTGLEEADLEEDVPEMFRFITPVSSLPESRPGKLHILEEDGEYYLVGINRRSSFTYAKFPKEKLEVVRKIIGNHQTIGDIRQLRRTYEEHTQEEISGEENK